MKVYAPHPSDDPKHGQAFWVDHPSNELPTGALPLPHVLGSGKFGDDYSPASPVSDEVLKELSSGKCLLIDTANGLRDTYGDFNSARYSGMPIFDAALIELLDELDPSVNEFIELPFVWGTKENQEIFDKFFLVNILRKVDGLDHSRIHEMVREDGSKIKIRQGDTRLRRNAVAGFHIWRDEATSEVFVSEEFVRRASEVGIEGVRFDEVRLE